MRSFCRKTHVHKIPRFRGGGYFGFWGGGECRFYFYGRADFSDKCSLKWLFEKREKNACLHFLFSLNVLFPPKQGKDVVNSVQTRCIVKGEAQKSPLFWRFSGGFWFSQDRLFSRNSTRKALNLIKSLIFTNAPCKTACLYNAPSMHTLDVVSNRKSRQQTGPKATWHIFSHILPTIVTDIITKLIRWEFSPVVLRSKFTELITGEFSSGSSLQQFAGFCSWNSVRVSSDRWTEMCCR